MTATGIVERAMPSAASPVSASCTPYPALRRTRARVVRDFWSGSAMSTAACFPASTEASFAHLAMSAPAPDDQVVSKRLGAFP